MPELTITLTDDQWESLVQLSRAFNDKKVSDTVLSMVLESLRIFLKGKQVGLERGREIAMMTVEEVLNGIKNGKV